QRRDEMVAAAADRCVVIGSADRLADGRRPPVPLELLAFGLPATLHAVRPVVVRAAELSPDGGVLADHMGGVGDPAALAARLAGTPGVVEHGLFTPDLVTDVVLGRP